MSFPAGRKCFRKQAAFLLSVFLLFVFLLALRRSMFYDARV